MPLVKTRKLSEIRKKIEGGSAVVMTVKDLMSTLANGKQVGFEDVDVVTTGTKGLMSGITGVFSFELTEPKKYKTFKSVTLNGIPGYVGPCPNESLGEIDIILYGTAHSTTREGYGGGFFFRDLVEQRPVEVIAETDTGDTIKKEVTLEDMKFARLLGTRQTVMNYNALINVSDSPVSTIFSVVPLEPFQLSFCGCGALNPLQNDPDHETLGIGSPILVNGQTGYIIGPGTRNYVSKPNLMTIADFKGMKPEYMGGFMTSAGPESICSIAMAIPVLNERTFDNLIKSDGDVPLNILNVVGREKLGETTYGEVWCGNDVVSYTSEPCGDCSIADECPVATVCPTGAFTLKKGIDKTRCFNCGTCVRICPTSAFSCDLKTVKFEGRDVPVWVRESDRCGATKIANELKRKILKGKFPLHKPTGKLEFYGRPN